MKLAITGANSSVGCNLLTHLADKADWQIVAGVRSESAMASLPSAENIEATCISYDQEASLLKAFQGVDSVVHLAGILMESKTSRYHSANVSATQSVVKAAQAAGVKHVVFISVVGADADSSNRYFQSKGLAEKAVMASGLAATVIRTPILLGKGTAGSGAIVGMAKQSKIKVLGGGHYVMRPLDIDNLSSAIINSCGDTEAISEKTALTHELVGPEPIAYRDLISKTAELLGSAVEIGAVPVWSAKLGSGLVSLFKTGGMTPTVIDVITMNEFVEHNADEALGVALTPLEDTLRKIID